MKKIVCCNGNFLLHILQNLSNKMDKLVFGILTSSALLSAWYYWILKKIGLSFNLNKIQPWILFIGVNLTFFSQHFLGLQGMVITSEGYLDAFAGWNLISSLGSTISVMVIYLFLDLVYVQLKGDKNVTRHPWSITLFYTDILKTLTSRVSTSLEWVLSNPPKPHAFISLSLQSSISKKTISWRNILIKSSTLLIISFLLRSLLNACFIATKINFYFDITLLGICCNWASFVFYSIMSIAAIMLNELHPSTVPLDSSLELKKIKISPRGIELTTVNAMGASSSKLRDLSPHSRVMNDETLSPQESIRRWNQLIGDPETNRWYVMRDAVNENNIITARNQEAITRQTLLNIKRRFLLGGGAGPICILTGDVEMVEASKSVPTGVSLVDHVKRVVNTPEVKDRMIRAQLGDIDNFYLPRNNN